MKQTTKRIISMLLSVLMLVTSLPVLSFAAANDVLDEAYYNEIVKDAVVVNSEWAGYANGDTVEYYYRNKVIREKFDENIHFTNFDDAYKYCIDNNIMNPVIILCPGVYSTAMTITEDVTIFGTNAGIDPNTNKVGSTPWKANSDMRRFTSLACVVEIEKFVSGNIEVVFDGVKFIDGFAYVDAGSAKAETSVVVRNSVFENISAPTWGTESLTNVFHFQKAASKAAKITFNKIRIQNINVSLIGNYVTTIKISDMYYGDSKAPLTNDIDALAGENPDYLISDSMFYNNVTEFGVIVIDHNQKDSTTRSKTNLEISGCKFIDGPANDANANNSTAPAITYMVTGAKNKVNIRDCEFIANKDHSNSPIRFTYAGSTLNSAISDSIFVNSNKFIGYTTLIDTTGLLKQSKLDFTGNYFANAKGKQIDPVYPSSSSYNNINMDYYFVDSNKTVPSNIYHVTSVGDCAFEARNSYKTMYITLDQGKKLDFDIKTLDASTIVKVYSDDALTKEVTSLDSSSLYTGENKNVFYVVATSTKAPDYKFIYTLYVSTYNPLYAPEFNMVNTFMYSPTVKGMQAGTSVCKDWDGTSYNFVVGETIFGTLEELYKVADPIPTILMPAGVYNEAAGFSESSIVLGAKHGINPNVPQFEKPEEAWLLNDERSNPDEETVFENCAIYIPTTAVNVTLEVDGITLGEASGFYDMGEKLETYTTTTFKNVLINNAGGASLKDIDAAGKEIVRTSNNIFHFGGTNDDYKNNHKDVRLINIRMENQPSYYLVGTYMESLLIDGLYYSGSDKRIHNSELTAPKGQNFTLDIRNSCFYNCTPSTAVIIVTNKQTDSPERKFNKVSYDHNIFYQPSKYLYGIVGIRFNSSRDSFYFTNNYVLSTYAQHSLMPGNSGWFTGATACESLSPDQYDTAETVTDVTIKFNRICGPYRPVDKQNVKPDTCWDYSYNYVCDLDDATKAGGNFENGIFNRNTPGIKMSQYSETQKNYMKCTTYFKDWNFTELVNAPDSFCSELEYEINGNGVIDYTNRTYTDTVAANKDTYNIDVNVITTQASYGFYADPDCTIKIDETLTLDKTVNEYYIKVASYKDTVVHIYKVTIAKQIKNEANLISIDNHSINGSNITAIVPVGTTSLLLNNIVVSSGATYKIFNDAEKKVPFKVTKITNISDTPTYKYIEVTSADGAIVNDYTLSVKQGINTLADVTSIVGAVKTGDTTFEASVPVDATYFDIIPTFSSKAKLTIKNEGHDHVVEAGASYRVYNLGNGKDVEITVTSEAGNAKTFILKISRDKSCADLSYIFNMYNDGHNAFATKVNDSTFTVLPTFKTTTTTYKIYSDKALTSAINGNVINLTKATTVVYLKSTSADGSDSKVYKLTLNTNNPAAPAAPEVDFDASKVFTDVVDGSWYETYVSYAVAKGIFAGTSNTTFSPDMKMTRAQFVRVLANIEGVALDDNVTTQFSDVASGQWYTGAVKWAADNNIVLGSGDGKFNPNDNITREQMCVMLVSYMENYKKATLKEVNKKADFKDDAQISTWAKTEVYKCQVADLISGTGDGNFSPLNACSRAEGATLFTSFHSNYLAN